MAFNINQRLNGLEPLAYAGVNAVQPPDFVTKPRPPTANDSKNFYLGQIWLDTGTNTPPTASDIYMLVALLGNQATWVTFGAGSLQTLTGNSGGAVNPDGAFNINVVGDGTYIDIVGNPGTNTLTASLINGGTFATSFPTDSGTATPAAGVLNIKAANATLNAGSTVLFSAPGPSNTVQFNVTNANNTTIVGKNSGNLTLTGANNTVFGAVSAQALTSSPNNTIIGEGSATLLAGGSGNNTIIGQSASASLLTGANNVVVGKGCGTQMTGSESYCIYMGDSIVGRAGDNNTIEIGNSTIGVFITNRNGVKVGNAVGNFTATGIANHGLGDAIFQLITTGRDNSAFGGNCLQNLTTGSNNACLGNFAGSLLTTGSSNTLVGVNACYANTPSGLLTGSNNVVIGASAGDSYTGAESDNILIGAGNNGVVGENQVTRIGFGNSATLKTFIDGIRGITTVNNDAIAVLIDSAGQLGTVSSSRRYKENINDMGSYSDVLRQLRPVTFNYKKHSPEWISVGLIAEEVAEVAPQLVVYDKDGLPETVKYHDLVPMLLNEQQQHCKLLADQQAIIADLMNRVKLLEEDLIKRSCC